MRHTTIKSRWHSPRPPYSGNWRQNPWINTASDSPQARLEVADDDCYSRQQKAAIRVWEDEGGSIRTDGHLRC